MPDAATEARQGSMLALIPSEADASRLTVEGGLPTEDLHLTLAYLGDGELGTEQRDAVLQAAESLADEADPISGQAFGVSQFNPAGDEPAAVYAIGDDSGTLAELQANVMTALASTGLTAEQHSPWQPHVTAGYQLTDTAPLTERLGDVTFDRLRVALADDITDYPLDGAARVQDEQPEADEPEEDQEEPLMAASGSKVPIDIPVVIIEGLTTADGRTIREGALSHRALPIPILAQTQNPVGGEGHDGAYVVGQLTELERVPGPEVTSRETGQPFPDGTFVWRGSGWVNPNVQGGDLVTGDFNEESGTWEGGILIGNSADLTEVEAEYILDEDADPEQALAEEPGVEITAGKISATTLCPIPAFADSYVVVDGHDMTQPVTAGGTPMWRSEELGDLTCLPCALGEEYANVSQEKRDRAESEGHAMPGGRFPIENREDLQNAIHAVGRAGGPEGTESDRNEVRRHIIRQAKRLNAQDMIPDNWNSDGTLKEEAALTAAGQLYPPAWMFTDPQLDGETPLTIEHDEASGWRRVYGHIAPWGVCHTGILGKCRTAPKSRTGYAYFHVGAVRAYSDDGDDGAVEIPVGHITMDTGHEPSAHSGAQVAAAHYDNTGTVAADIAVGEDKHGIWFSGAVRRRIDADKEAELLAAPLSGDWRPVQEGMELVAALAVNQPGFPIKRVKALVASGAIRALQVTTTREQFGQRYLPDGTPAAAGAVVLDYDQLADAIAARLSGQVPLPGTPAAYAREAQEDAGSQALALRARRAGALLDLV